MLQERQPKKENSIYYDAKSTQALEFAREKARTEDIKVVSFGHLIEGINNQIPLQEKSDIYNTYGIEMYILKLKIGQTVATEGLDLERLDEAYGTDTVLQFSPLAQRAIRYAEELATLKQNQILEVYDLFIGAAKVAEDECTAQ